MNERQAQILGLVVEEYVRAAKPVGSLQLADLLPWTVSSATTRNLLREVEEEGYIFQPHTSAGRVPTDQGYRYYVDHGAPARFTKHQIEHIRAGYEEMAEEYRHVNRSLVKLVAHLAHSLAVSYHVGERDVQEAGLSELMEEPEGQEPKAVREISHFLEHIDDYLEELASSASDATVVVIGRENRMFKAQYTSVVLRPVRVHGANRIILAIIGPKRMPYGRHVRLLEGVARLVEEGKIL